MKTGASNNSSTRYHRYCGQCGWGFTRNAWAHSRFCVRCGTSLARFGDSGASEKLVEVEACPRRHRAGRKPRGRDGNSDWELFEESPSSSGLNRHRRKKTKHAASMTGTRRYESMVEPPQESGGYQDALGFIRQNPYTCAIAGGTAGAAMMGAGGVVSAVGLQITATGAAITTGSVIVGLLSMFGATIEGGKDGKSGNGMTAGFVVAAGGALIGTTVSVIGAVVSAAGVALGITGTVLVSLSALLAAARSAEIAWKHRQQIMALVRRARSALPGVRVIELRPVSGKQMDKAEVTPFVSADVTG